jgi:hypothetical protein
MTFHFQQCAMLNDFYVEYYFNIITKINLTKFLIDIIIQISRYFTFDREV